VLVDFLKPLAENVEMVYMYQKGVKWREMARNPFETYGCRLLSLAAT
jgi:hypothetical protein